MNDKDFISRLKLKYPKGINDVEIEDVMKWLVSQNLSEQQIEDLYEYVAHQYKYRQFPNLATIIEIWQTTAPSGGMQDDDDFVVNSNRKLSVYYPAWEQFSVGKTISILQAIRHHINTDVKNTRQIEKEFYYKYENILFEHGLCEELKIIESERMDHLSHVKRMIDQGKPYRSMFDIHDMKNRSLNVDSMVKTI